MAGARRVGNARSPDPLPRLHGRSPGAAVLALCRRRLSRVRALGRGVINRDSDRKPYAVLDIETDGLRGPLLYWSAGCECDRGRIEHGRTAESLWRYVLSNSSRTHAARDHLWWAHHGGGYDYAYLFGPARDDALAGRATVAPVVRTDELIGFRITDHAKHKTELRDSFVLLPAALRALAVQLAPDEPKGDIGLGEGVRFDPENPAHRAYADQDIRTTLAVLTRFRAELAAGWSGTLPGWSAASTALRAWQSTLRPGERYTRPQPEAAKLAREGYYGGLTAIRSTEWHNDVLTVDLNAAYPAAMREWGVPDGWCFPTSTYHPGRPGFYHATVTVGRLELWTFLPYRDPFGNLAWPTGTFETVLSSVEIEAARARGITVDVGAGWYWTDLAYPFRRYVDRIETMRAQGGAVGAVAKLLAVSLYGKFGSRATCDDWMIAADSPGDDWWPVAGESDGALWGLWQRKDVPAEAPHLLPHWAAWITARVRVRLTEIAEAIGPADVLYADTDSVTARGPAVRAAIAAGRLTIGPAFGELKIEHRYERFRALAPKVTQGIEDGIPIYRAKGIPRKLVAVAFDTGTVAWDSPNGALQVMQGAAMTTPRTRVLSDIGGSVAWRARRDGSVRPVHLE